MTRQKKLIAKYGKKDPRTSMIVLLGKEFNLNFLAGCLHGEAVDGEKLDDALLCLDGELELVKLVNNVLKGRVNNTRLRAEVACDTLARLERVDGLAQGMEDPNQLAHGDVPLSVLFDLFVVGWKHCDPLTQIFCR